MPQIPTTPSSSKRRRVDDDQSAPPLRKKPWLRPLDTIIASQWSGDLLAEGSETDDDALPAIASPTPARKDRAPLIGPALAEIANSRQAPGQWKVCLGALCTGDRSIMKRHGVVYDVHHFGYVVVVTNDDLKKMVDMKLDFRVLNYPSDL